MSATTESQEYRQDLYKEFETGHVSPDLDDRTAVHFGWTKTGPRNGNGGLDENIVNYFNEIKHVPLLTAEEERTIGRKIKTIRDLILDQVLSCRTKLAPLCQLQETIRNWRADNSGPRESIDYIFLELDRILKLVEKLRSPDKGLAGFLSAGKRLRAEYAEVIGQLVQANLRLAITIAKRYQGRGLALADLIQEANVGLIKAAVRFDFATGNRFSTFAAWWIRHAIYRALYEHARIVRLPEHMHEARNQVHRAYLELVRELGREPTHDEISSRSGLSLEKVLMVVQLTRDPVSLETPLNPDGDRIGDLIPNADAISPLEATQEAELLRLTMRALDKLPARERMILSLRFGLNQLEPCTLAEVGEKLQVSRERARILEARAVKLLRRSLNKYRLNG
jgi:RNA polymerase primary sigma factor